MEPQSPSNLGLPKDGRSLSTIILTILLVLALALAGWAFLRGQDYKSNADKKSAAAAAEARKDEAAKVRAELEQQSKAPHKVYSGSATYGSVSFEYPKTWSAYIDESSSSQPVNGFFHPDYVPGLQSGTAYALRLEVLNSPYATVLDGYESQISAGVLKASAYVPAKMAAAGNVQTGVRLVGELDSSGKFQGSMVIMKVRDKTLRISTQSNDYAGDFNNIILASLTFTP